MIDPNNNLMGSSFIRHCRTEFILTTRLYLDKTLLSFRSLTRHYAIGMVGIDATFHSTAGGNGAGVVSHPSTTIGPDVHIVKKLVILTYSANAYRIIFQVFATLSQPKPYKH